MVLQERMFPDSHARVLHSWRAGLRSDTWTNRLMCRGWNWMVGLIPQSVCLRPPRKILIFHNFGEDAELILRVLVIRALEG